METSSPSPAGGGDERWASLCNCVVNFLMEERYHLTALELMQELEEDGRQPHALRLRSFFSDTALFPPDLLARHHNTNPVADPQSLLEEKVSLEERLALTEYDLRLAQEDMTRLKFELQKLRESAPDELNGALPDTLMADGPRIHQRKREITLSSLGPLKENERKDLNCAVKEYLLFAGYRLTAMTFIEEVPDQNLDIWPNSSACVPDALRRYYYQYLSSTSEAAEEKISILRENETLSKENEKLNAEKNSLLKNKDSVTGQVVVLTKSLEAAQKDLKDKEKVVQDLKQSLDLQRKELNDCRAEITALKMHIEGARSSKRWTTGNTENMKPATVDNSMGEALSLNNETESLKRVDSSTNRSLPEDILTEDVQKDERVFERNDTEGLPGSVASFSSNSESGVQNISGQGKSTGTVALPENSTNVNLQETLSSANATLSKQENSDSQMYVSVSHGRDPLEKLDSPSKERASDKMALETVQIVSDALPKIVPYVLINHREELLPLIMCAIERHPDSNVRDSLTHTLFNLIKRPDEQQRRIIMDACVNLAKSVGEMRTETELLPQCWEQINHKYEERRLLVAQSCGELAEYVRPEIRDSLILSIVQQLVEDSATVVREAATHNLALLLPLFPNTDKYFKVEELLFQLVCDPSGVVVDIALKELVPAVIKWGGNLDHVLRVVLSHILGSAQRCPPLSGVEGTPDSHLRVLGERERWNIDVLLRMLTVLLPFIYQRATETCPFTSSVDAPTNCAQGNCMSASSLKQYAMGHMDWSAFKWMHIDCLPDLIKLACLLPQKEDNLKTGITKYLLDVSGHYGKDYLEHIMLPVFLMAVGDDDSADLTFFPLELQSKIKGLRPRSSVTERLAVMCVLPLLLSGVLGSPSSHEQLAEYLRKILIQNTVNEGSWSAHYTAELIDAVRFLCIFEQHHVIVFSILWEMVVSSDIPQKINAAALLKVLVPYTDVKVASTHVLPALVTLGSEQNLTVKYASINAFGAVAQHFKNEMIVDKICIQMDAFLEDGSHQATVSVVRALVVAVPHTTDRLREYLLLKINKLTSVPLHENDNDIARRRERANVFCEAIRALDATDLPATTIRDLLLPSIQNLLKDTDALDPAHKEALEVILRERSGGTFESISKVMGAHLGIASSVSSFFGESGLLGKKESGETHEPTTPSQPSPQAQQDDTRFGRIMRGGFGDMLRGKGKGSNESG